MTDWTASLLPDSKAVALAETQSVLGDPLGSSIKSLEELLNRLKGTRSPSNVAALPLAYPASYRISAAEWTRLLSDMIVYLQTVEDKTGWIDKFIDSLSNGPLVILVKTIIARYLSLKTRAEASLLSGTSSLYPNFNVINIPGAAGKNGTAITTLSGEAILPYSIVYEHTTAGPAQISNVGLMTAYDLSIPGASLYLLHSTDTSIRSVSPTISLFLDQEYLINTLYAPICLPSITALKSIALYDSSGRLTREITPPTGATGLEVHFPPSLCREIRFTFSRIVPLQAEVNIYDMEVAYSFFSAMAQILLTGFGSLDDIGLLDHLDGLETSTTGVNTLSSNIVIGFPGLTARLVSYIPEATIEFQLDTDFQQALLAVKSKSTFHEGYTETSGIGELDNPLAYLDWISFDLFGEIKTQDITSRVSIPMLDLAHEAVTNLGSIIEFIRGEASIYTTRYPTTDSVVYCGEIGFDSANPAVIWTELINGFAKFSVPRTFAEMYLIFYTVDTSKIAFPQVSYQYTESGFVRIYSQAISNSKLVATLSRGPDTYITPRLQGITIIAKSKR